MFEEVKWNQLSIASHDCSPWFRSHMLWQVVVSIHMNAFNMATHPTPQTTRAATLAVYMPLGTPLWISLQAWIYSCLPWQLIHSYAQHTHTLAVWGEVKSNSTLDLTQCLNVCECMCEWLCRACLTRITQRFVQSCSAASIPRPLHNWETAWVVNLLTCWYAALHYNSYDSIIVVKISQCYLVIYYYRSLLTCMSMIKYGVMSQQCMCQSQSDGLTFWTNPTSSFLLSNHKL